MTQTDIHSYVDPDSPHLFWMELDRPDARNAWSDKMLAGFVAALDQAAADERVRCVILTGRGPSFSAGGDLKAMRDRAGMFAGGPVELRTRYSQGIQSIPRRLARFDKPVVAAVNGAAIGAGLDLACMCDIRVASADAKFGSTFVKVGLVPGDGGAYLLTRTIGFPRALDLILTGRVIDSDEALRIGLVHTVVPADQVRDAARKAAERIARNAPLAVQLAKSACYRSYDLSLEPSLELAASYQGIVQNSDDHLEGVAAILERRRPSFDGH